MKKSFILAMVALFMLVFTGSVFAASWSPDFGKPRALEAAKNQGYYIWQDKNGIHLRTTAKGGTHVFRGIVQTNGQFTDINKSQLEKNDTFKLVNPFKNKIEFRFNTANGVDGFDFNVADGKKVQFELFIDGQRISSDKIYIGEDNWHPETNKFKIYRS